MGWEGVRKRGGAVVWGGGSNVKHLRMALPSTMHPPAQRMSLWSATTRATPHQPPEQLSASAPTSPRALTTRDCVRVTVCVCVCRSVASSCMGPGAGALGGAVAGGAGGLGEGPEGAGVGGGVAGGAVKEGVRAQ